MPTYEPPQITDYGTLLELTESGGIVNMDTPAGVPNTGFPTS